MLDCRVAAKHAYHQSVKGRYERLDHADSSAGFYREKEIVCCKASCYFKLLCQQLVPITTSFVFIIMHLH